MNATVSAVALGLLAGTAFGQVVLFDQPMAPNGGDARPSQLWIDPSGQNDSDNDAIAWEDFRLAQSATITHLRWWGQALPPHGFEISFWNQDPGTVAMQPDLFSGPFSEHIYPNVSQTSVGGGMYRFDLQLVAPESFQADTRYFVSIVGRTAAYSAEWLWAEGGGVNTGTFWWARGAHMYFILPNNRALQLLGPATCAADMNSDGTLDFFDVQAFLQAFAAHGPAADFNADSLFDFFDVQAFLQAFAAGCP